jgi:hypothetical protein
MTAEFIKIVHSDGSVEYRHPNIEQIEQQSLEQTSKEVVKQFTPEQLSEMLRCQAEAQARQYLAQTDWYAARLAETGEPIPQDVLAQRTAARQTLST